MTEKENIIQSFDALTSSVQNEVLKELIVIAVNINADVVLTAIVDKIGCEKASEKLTSIITDYAY